jgi:hypothetical protein
MLTTPVRDAIIVPALTTTELIGNDADRLTAKVPVVEVAETAVIALV